MKIGLIGLPNAGKSTLFKALTKKQVDIQIYPFCTIEPNVGVVQVTDERLKPLAEISKSERIIPAMIEFVDIAGLVRGAHKGEGLGNEFLSHIREVDACLHVVRGFENRDVAHTEGRLDAKKDLEIINLELIMADLQILQTQEDKLAGEARSREKAAQKLYDTVKKALDFLNQEKLLLEVQFSQDELNLLKPFNLLTLKPMIVVVNGSVGTEHCSVPTANLQINAQLEAEIADLSKKEAQEYFREFNLQETGLNRLIRASYKLLDLITFLTTGPKETRAWTVKAGSTAPQAGGKIHSDFEKNFIRAEVIEWQELLRAKSELKARELGLMRTEGKKYIVEDGDVMHFLIG